MKGFVDFSLNKIGNLMSTHNLLACVLISNFVHELKTNYMRILNLEYNINKTPRTKAKSISEL